MKKFFLVFTAIIAISFSANAGNYKVNDSNIDALFASATEVTADAVTNINAMMPSDPLSASVAAKYPSAWGAWAICTFVGGFGVHRHYLGTRPFMWLIYTVTFFGIFGIVPTVDWVLLLIGAINDDIEQYVGNTRFIMW